MGGRLIGNNQRIDNQEFLLKELSDAIMGLREEMAESRNSTQQIQETQKKIERKIEEEKNRAREEIKRGIDSVKTQEDKQQGGIRYGQTKGHQVLV